MSDSDTDTDNNEYDSALSSGILPHPKCSQTHIPSKQRATDRLYSASSSKQIGFDENTALLSPGIQSYHSTPLLESSDAFDSGSSAPLTILTRKISRVFQSKAYDYDSNKTLLAAVGSGERVWYNDLSALLISGSEITGPSIGYMILSKISFERKS